MHFWTSILFIGMIYEKIKMSYSEKLGQRAHVGKVNMVINCPEYYMEDTRQSLDDTRTFIDHTLSRKARITQDFICNFRTNRFHL